MKQPALPFHIYKPSSPHSPCLQNIAAAQQNTACGVSCCDPKYSLTRSSPAVILCCFWLWAVDALWQLTIIFHIHTLPYPHSLPRQFPLAKLPSSFSHIFSMFFFFCFLLSSTVIRCSEKQKQPIACKPFFLFLFWCTSVGFNICKSSFPMFYLPYFISEIPMVHVSSRCHVLFVLFLHCGLVQYISHFCLCPLDL